MIAYSPSTAPPLEPATARPAGRAHAAPMVSGRPSMALVAVTVLLAGGINFLVVWKQFYAGLPYLFDTGWYAALVYRAAPLVENPSAVTFATIGPLFYSTHFSPILWVLSLPSHLLPLSPPVWLACVEAAKHMMIAAVGGGLLHALTKSTPAPTHGKPARVAAGIVLVLLPFNGLLLAGMAYPHFELWFLPPSLVFLWALFRERPGVAAAAFVVALSVREDIGFHLCGLLVIATGARWLATRRWEPRMGRWLAFSAAGFAASAGALLLMRWQFPGDSAFTRIYAGDPAYAHLTGAELIDRLQFILSNRGHLWLPLVVYIGWALIARTGWMLVGYAAFIPWFMLNVTAASLAPGTLSLYYIFPFALALLWPLVAGLIFAPANERAHIPRWVAAALVVSIVGYVRQPDAAELGRALAWPDREAKVRLDAIIDRLATSRAEGASILVDDGVAALAPNRFDAGNLVGQHAGDPTLAAFYGNGRAAKAAWEQCLPLAHHYAIAGLPLVIASAEPLDWPDLNPLRTERGSLATILRGDTLSLAWAANPDDATKPRTVVAGPDDWHLAPGGEWNADFAVWIEPGAGAVICEVLADGRVVASTLIALDSAERSRVARNVRFRVPGPHWPAITLRVRVRGTFAGRIDDLSLRPVTTERDAS